MKLSNRLRLCACVSGAAFLVAVSVDAFAKETRVPLPKPAPHKRAGAVHLSRVDPVVQPAALPEQVAPVTNVAPNDLTALRQAFDAARKGKIDTATELQKSIADPAGRKLVEWMLLRSNEASVPFERYAAFVNTNANWPSIGMFRRRAEGALWDDRRNQAMVLSFFAQARPLSAKGKLALARALLAQGERSRAYDFVREAWWQDGMSKDLETQALEAFPRMLTLADHKVRMDRRLYAEDQEAALRAALRLGGAELAIAKARMAVSDMADNVKALLEAVPVEARADIGYTFSYMQHLRRNDRLDEAAKLMLAAPRDLSLIHDSDEWWTERRLLARKLLDAGDAATAYRITRDAVPPSKENPRAEHQFTAGWIALRFLDDPASAAAHFARVGQATSHPATLARAHYWQGRAAEALGQREQARGQYEAAARFSTAYYGQIARGRLGNSELVLRRPPSRLDGHHPSARYSDLVRAAELLYALNERDLVITFVSDLGEHATDLSAMAAIADLATRHGDARSMLFLGKPVLARGLPFDTVAYPDFGVPKFGIVGPEIERSLVYAIVRQESAFNSKAVSTANAIGLMQVTPGTGRAIAKKFGIAFDRKRLLNDASYNAQLGAAELANLIASYRGSYILAFAAYNAGPGRVREWIERYGDPRRPGVDPVDWVERIPFSETRNYVQRVMENFQVYRVRLGNNSRLTIDSDLRRGAL